MMLPASQMSATTASDILDASNGTQCSAVQCTTLSAVRAAARDSRLVDGHNDEVLGEEVLARPPQAVCHRSHAGSRVLQGLLQPREGEGEGGGRECGREGMREGGWVGVPPWDGGKERARVMCMRISFGQK